MNNNFVVDAMMQGGIMVADFYRKQAFVTDLDGTVLFEVSWAIFEDINATNFWQLDSAAFGTEWYRVIQG